MTFYEDRSVGQVSPRNDGNSYPLQDCKLPMSENYAVTTTEVKTFVVLMKQQLEEDLEGWGFLF